MIHNFSGTHKAAAGNTSCRILNKMKLIDGFWSETKKERSEVVDLGSNWDTNQGGGGGPGG